MPLHLVRQRRLPDGRIETFEPLKNADGYYVLADRAVDPQHNKASNQFYVKDIRSVVARLKKGGVSLRMRGDITGQPNLISAAEIKIVADESRDDPFSTFHEWSSDADEQAFGSL